MKVKVINHSRHPLPQYQTEHAAAVDLIANIDQPLVLAPMQRALVPTGISIALPSGWEAQLRPRSGLAIKHGITIVNAPATIDADYRGELKVILVNLGSEPFTVHDGDRIAQMVVAPCQRIEWQLVDKLDGTARGGGEFGHTGN